MGLDLYVDDSVNYSTAAIRPQVETQIEYVWLAGVMLFYFLTKNKRNGGGDIKKPDMHKLTHRATLASPSPPSLHQSREELNRQV